MPNNIRVVPFSSRCAVALIAVLGLLMAACGSDSNADLSAAPATDPEAATATAQDDSAVVFPVSVEHKFGSTEIAEKPERVVSLGFQEHDTVFALGVEPVAVRYWYGPEDDVIFPWAEDAAGDADPDILNMAYGELNFEKIAALDPDVILGVYAGITEKEYETLSAIAPTVAQSGDFVDFGEPWQDATRTIGATLGRSEQADKLVDDVETKFADIKAAHPEWDGLEVVVATRGEDDLGAFASQDLRSRFFTDLGFSVPGAIDDAAPDGQFYATLSLEQADLLDADVLFWDQVSYVSGGRSTIEADPILSGLDAMVDGRAVFVGEFEDAFAWNSVLSLPVALDGIVPMLERATDGNPATVPSPAA